MSTLDVKELNLLSLEEMLKSEMTIPLAIEIICNINIDVYERSTIKKIIDMCSICVWNTEIKPEDEDRIWKFIDSSLRKLNIDFREVFLNLKTS